MRLIILNPHANQCGNMVFNWLFRFPQHHKYSYLWKRTGKDDDREVAFLIDGTQSSFYQTALFEKTIARIPALLRVFVFLEFWVWKKLNNIDSKTCSILFNHKNLNPKKDIIFSFGFTSFNSTVRTYAGIVLVHLSHYHLHTKQIADFTKSLKNGFIVSEGAIENNPYFQHYFPNFLKRTYLLPFTFDPGRFKNITPFHQRINTCFASGPMSVPSSPSYIAYYGDNAPLNPMREIIYLQKENIADAITAYIYPHDYASKEMRRALPNDSRMTKFAKKLFPMWVLTSVLKYKLPYFSFDIVKKYNEHMMFSSPEERTGLPSVKLFEGILCGSVLVGIDDPMYTSIGFKDGENYISYKENDMANLIEKIRFYQKNPDTLERIAKNGYEFAASRFSPQEVARIFWKDLETAIASHTSGNTKLSCSFVHQE